MLLLFSFFRNTSYSEMETCLGNMNVKSCCDVTLNLRGSWNMCVCGITVIDRAKTWQNASDKYYSVEILLSECWVHHCALECHCFTVLFCAFIRTEDHTIVLVDHLEVESIKVTKMIKKVISSDCVCVPAFTCHCVCVRERAHCNLSESCIPDCYKLYFFC